MNILMDNTPFDMKNKEEEMPRVTVNCIKKTTDDGKRRDNKRVVLKKGEAQREDGRYVYRWTDRKKKRHSIYGKTLAELRRKEDEIKKDQLDGMRTMEKNSLNDLFDLWCEVKRGLKDNTFQNYKYMYNAYVRESIGRQKVTKLKKSDIRAFYNKLVDEEVLRPRTLDVIQNVLHQVLDIAVEDMYIRTNPADKALAELKRERGFDKRKRKALTLEEQNELLEYLSKNHKFNRWYSVLAFMLGTGMRVGEITGLRGVDVDMERGFIDINHTLVYYDHGNRHCAYEVNTTKTEASNRVIPILKLARKALLLEKEYQMSAGIRCQKSISGYTDFVFLNRFGDVLNNGVINKAIRRIVRDHNDEEIDKNGDDAFLLPMFSCHSLRHTFTTRMIEAGVNVKVVQDTLGHTDVSTTLNIYADVTDDLKKEEFKQLDEYFDENVI